MIWRRLFSLAVLPLCLGGMAPGLHASSRAREHAKEHAKDPSGPGPEQRIPVAPLGYHPPGQLYLLSNKVFSSLDFIDAHHLLFTFHESRLLQREQNADRAEDDQLIRAITLRLPDGQVLDSSQWRMHDRARYLWPLGGGKFLVRERNSYLLTDASLKLSPYVDVATPVFATEVSPDGRILVVEHEYEKHTPDQHTKLQKQAAEFGDPPPLEDTQITLLNVSSRQVLAALHTQLPLALPITTTGYVGVTKEKDKDEFVVRFMPFEGEPVVLGRVASACTPRERFINARALIIESCGPKTQDVFLDVWTIEGKKLWSGHRDGRLVLPTLAYSRTGDRFAVGLVRVAHPVDLIDSVVEDDVREQVVQVYDAATGALLLATNASPILTVGENFALSDDGEHLAVLREGAIEIYKVPAAPAPASGSLAQKK